MTVFIIFGKIIEYKMKYKFAEGELRNKRDKLYYTALLVYLIVGELSVQTKEMTPLWSGYKIYGFHFCLDLWSMQAEIKIVILLGTVLGIVPVY